MERPEEVAGLCRGGDRAGAYLRLVLHLALRQIEGFARSLLRLLGLDLRVPDHSTLSRWSRAFAGRQPRAARHDEPVHVVLDSTGLQFFGQGAWDAEKYGRTPRQWRKLHLTTVEAQIASVITDSAYDGMSVSDAAVARQHEPPPHIVILPKASSIVDSDADTQTVRDRHVKYIAGKERLAWQRAHGYG